MSIFKGYTVAMVPFCIKEMIFIFSYSMASTEKMFSIDPCKC